MKKLFICLFVLITIGSVTAQLTVRIYNYRPTGDYGAVFKPTISAEIGSMRQFDEDNRVRWVFTGTALYLKPRMAEFPTTGEIEDGNGLKVYPGTMAYKLYLAVQAHIGIDVALYRTEKFNAFIGTNAIIGGVLFHYHSVIPGFQDNESIGSGTQLGVRFRAGGEYQLNDQLGFLISANRSYGIMLSADAGGFFSANDYGIGVSYKF
ncbi:MAG: hypothetical protein JWO09_1585 [Bacteroidetes bacterium]|nr:hypothetical protein [Bacteroidota bacterium]